MKTQLNGKTGMFIFLASMFLVFGCENQPNRKTAVAANEHHEDMGKKPWVLDIEEATIANTHYRIAKWSGEYMQMVLMSLSPGEIIDLEVHEDHDQFIRIEQGKARVFMGETKDNLTYEEDVSDDWAIFIPAGYWHQVRNTGNTDLKLYTIYAPSEHPDGTLHETYEKARGHKN
jgi:mannose-6-phosphate isomerase-like protein (cupin superfamily)